MLRKKEVKEKVKNQLYVPASSVNGQKVFVTLDGQFKEVGLVETVGRFLQVHHESVFGQVVVEGEAVLCVVIQNTFF